MKSIDQTQHCYTKFGKPTLPGVTLWGEVACWSLNTAPAFATWIYKKR